jgi:hypothetical protein
MARLGNNRNKNLSRANSIISGMQDEEGVEAQPIVEGDENIETPPVVETPPAVIDTPPVVEVQAVESAPIVSDTPPVAEQEKVVPQVEVTDKLIFEKLSETLGREVKSYDDLTPKEVKLDDEVKQLLEWKEKTGLSLSKWADYNKDFSKLTDLDVAKEILAEKYPDFTEEELEFSMRGYIYDELDDDESDRIAKSIALKKFAKEGRETLEQNKISFLESQPKSSLSVEEKELVDYAKTVKQNEAGLKDKNVSYQNSLKEASLKLQAINLDLGDGLKINHNVAQESKKDLVDYINTMPDWYKEDGSFNHENIARDSYKLKNFDTIIKSAFEQGKSYAIEGKIRENNNISLDPNSIRQDNDEKEQGNIKEVVANLTGKNSSKFRFRKSKNK